MIGSSLMTDKTPRSNGKIYPWSGKMPDFSEMEGPDLFTWSLTSMFPPYLFMGKSGMNEDVIAWPYYYYCNKCSGRITLFIPTVFSGNEMGSRKAENVPFLKCPRCESVASEYCDLESGHQ